MATLGLHNTPFGNTIAPPAFNSGYHFMCFDLTSSLGGNATNVAPATLGGKYTLEISFNKTTVEPLVAIIFGEFTSQMTIPKDGKAIGFSYVN